jgi:hypothetical protein
MARRSRTAHTAAHTAAQMTAQTTVHPGAQTAPAEQTEQTAQHAATPATSSVGDGQRRAGQTRRAVRFSAPPRQRRRGWFAGAVALLALAVLVNVYLVRSAAHRIPVAVVVRDVPIGQEISRADLGVTQVSTGSAVRVVPARQLPQVVGNRAAVDLRRGSLLTPAQITGDVTPHRGQALVAVAVKPSQLPPRGLRPGASVSVVATPGNQGQDTAGDVAGGAGSGQAAALPRDVAATVDEVSGPDTEGVTSLSLIVAQADAAALARQASTGRIAVIVTARTP